MQKNKSVCAAIVTFNRKNLLLRCLNNIIEQGGGLKKILVVDNNSTDGSEQFILENFSSRLKYKEINFKWIRLNENIGGAGGFNKAVKEFLLSEEDYLWLMDDDGFPAKDTLEQLLKYSNEFCYIGPAVISDKDENTLSFPMRLPNSLKIIDSLKDVYLKGEIIENIVLPFNGTLISRQVITSIGLPNENYFIWGDEVDYTERARKAGAQIFTVTSSKFFHPKAPNVGNPMFFGLLRYNDPNTDLKLYCYCRNNFANQKKYRGPLRASLFFFKSLWYYSLTRPSLRKLSIALKGLIAGCKGDFSHHCNFLK